MSNPAERLRAIEDLLKPLVRVDTGVLNLSVRLMRLRKENPHGLLSDPSRSNVSATQVQEVQDRISAWVDPILNAVAEAKDKSKGIARHLLSMVDDPVAWETDLRTNLRLLSDALRGLEMSLGSTQDEQLLVAICAQLNVQGTRLQDGCETLAGLQPPTPDDGGEKRSTGPRQPKQPAVEGKAETQHGRGLAKSLEELRQAVLALVSAAERQDTDPRPMVTAYRAALGKVNACAPALNEFFVDTEQGRQLETDLREHLKKLERAVEPILSAADRYPEAFPLADEIGVQVTEVLKGGMAVEILVALVTSNPADRQMSPEDSRTAGVLSLLLVAQAYYTILECAISTSGWCSAVDLHLNHSYLWVTTTLRNLLEHHEALKDFPVKFDPLFPDLYPCTIRDHDWDDDVAPKAEGFLSTVQQYVYGKNVMEPQEGAAAWCFIAMVRGSVDEALKHARAYYTRMRDVIRRVTAAPRQVSASSATLRSASDELVRLVSALRALPARRPSLARTTDNDVVTRKKQRAQSEYLDELMKLADKVVDGCEELLNNVDSGIGTAMRELVKRHTTTHGREHDPFNDELLATVIDEAMAIGRLNSIAPAPMHASVNAPGPKNEFRTSDRNQGMHQPEAYVPTSHDRQLFRDLMAVVRRDPDRFALAGAAIDTEYSTQGIRDRKAAEHRHFRRVLGDNYMSSSRAFRRRTCNYDDLARQLGFRPTPEQVVAPPPMRSKGQDGRPCHPDLPLRERFDTAFRETFEDDTSLDVLSADRRHELASRRILMAWLRVDPDRASVRRITEFQDLRTEPTEDGLPSLSMSDDADSFTFSKSLFVHRNGALEHNALAWITKARDALNTLTAEPGGGLVQQFTRKLHETLDMMVVLEHEKPRGDDWAHNQKLLDLKNSCIKSLRECYTLSGGLPDALKPVWTTTVAQEIADMRTAIDTLVRRMRASTANGFNHPILRVSDAPKDWKEDWDKHERVLWQMINRLACLDLGTPIVPERESANGGIGGTTVHTKELARRIGEVQRALFEAVTRASNDSQIIRESVFNVFNEIMADVSSLRRVERLDELAAKYPELAPSIAELQEAMKQPKSDHQQELQQRASRMSAGIPRLEDSLRVWVPALDDPSFLESIRPVDDRIKEAVKEVLAEHHGGGANTGRVKDDAGKGHPVKRRVKLECVETLIRDHLNRRPYDTASEVAKAVGCSVGLITRKQNGSKWWRINQVRLRECRKSGVNAIAVPLNDRWMNEHGAKKGGQMHAQRRAEAVQDEEIDLREKELSRRIDEYRKTHENASSQDVARVLNCTARDVELRDAQIARLVAEQADHANEDDHPLNPRTPKQKGRKWVTKQV